MIIHQVLAHGHGLVLKLLMVIATISVQARIVGMCIYSISCSNTINFIKLYGNKIHNFYFCVWSFFQCANHLHLGWKIELDSAPAGDAGDSGLGVVSFSVFTITICICTYIYTVSCQVTHNAIHCSSSNHRCLSPLTFRSHMTTDTIISQLTVLDLPYIGIYS